MRNIFVAFSLAALFALLLPRCSDDHALASSDDAGDSAATTLDVSPDTERDTSSLNSCGFDYSSQFAYDLSRSTISTVTPWSVGRTKDISRGVGFDGRGLPYPLSTRLLAGRVPAPAAGLVLPDYRDDLPLFERALAWTSERRCFELPTGGRLLTEAEAFELYAAIAEKTTGTPFNRSLDHRSVVGLRGAYPGTFDWHGNLPDRFNDTLALLWIDADGKHVRELPANTDTGAYEHAATSSLKPNRRYRYTNGWHGAIPYNALQIAQSDYPVRDDANHNGHADSARNGWLPPRTADDFDRTGSAHNIHGGSENSPLGSAPVHYWSAGCQVIPGMANWLEFISWAWTALGDPVDYFLVDVRDIPASAFAPCAAEGSRACPHLITAFPYTHSADTSTMATSAFDTCYWIVADTFGGGIPASGPYTLTVDFN